MDDLSSTAGVVALAGATVAVVALLIATAAFVRLRRLRADQRVLLGAAPGGDLMEHAARLERELQGLHGYVGDVAARLDGRLGTAEDRLDGTIAHRGLVRFDAYNEMSGRQSCSIALLDARQSGIVLSSIHHRDQARLYVKHVVEGRAELELAPEEAEAVRLALTGQPPPEPPARMRLGYFGPAGTFTHAALLASPWSADAEAVAFRTERETIFAAQDGAVDAALVPIENSLEGGVNATLDALIFDAPGVRIVGEEVLPISHALIARPGVALADVEAVVSHPQALGQCRRFLEARLPELRAVAATSTAEAVAMVAAAHQPWAAIGSAVAAGLSGCVVLEQGIEDEHDNETRFLWLSPGGALTPPPPAITGAWKSSIVFHGAGDTASGWLVRCLSELAFRGINLTRIESRPLKRRLGHYLFLADLEGRADDPQVAEAITGLRAHCEQVRVLGSYPAAS